MTEEASTAVIGTVITTFVGITLMFGMSTCAKWSDQNLKHDLQREMLKTERYKHGVLENGEHYDKRVEDAAALKNVPPSTIIEWDEPAIQRVPHGWDGVLNDPA